ncbi:hypothetical protein PR202_gb27455 [Eleusine coracana subsp. coracana]|uniref:KIB1-4 beta-propeller domain-containing protein n=1 Tax=Eleusine coracana subsp. coracana TaxID=191504 RepID=A0AAV5FU75_ELECO|nr:hypothetical protein QOZ80_4BG0358910 [Eleusine coracana subsp. coracana]GJN38418.1 hypothetical protein PR202_gb27455 [Eleusine coracana subsp. coracana]
MAGSRRRRQLKKQREQAAAARQCTNAADAIRVNFVERLPQELLAKIHGHFTLLDRLAFAAVCKMAGHPLTKSDTATPWLVFPGETEEKATFFSLAECRAVSARTSDLGTRGHVVLGSSSGWLATADDQAGIHIVDPFTGEHAALPDIKTVPFIRSSSSSKNWVVFHMDTAPFLKYRYGGAGRPPTNKSVVMPVSRSLTANQMRQWFYRKVVLSASPRRNNYAAMLILDQEFGVPAFATSEDTEWKVAASLDGIEDAIHHDGRFYSVSYAGTIEAWERDGVTGDADSCFCWLITSR